MIFKKDIKVGQVIQCIDSKGTKHLTKGKNYTIRLISPYYNEVYLKEAPGNYQLKRFSLTPAAFAATLSFNMKKNLLPGDKIKRIKENFGDCVSGQIYTFQRYFDSSSLDVVECNTHGLSIEKFVFVSRPGLVSVANKQTSTFENAKLGERVWDILSGWGFIVETDNGSGTIRAEFGAQKICYFTSGKRYGKDSLKSLYWDEINLSGLIFPFKKIKTIPTFKEEYIKAMRKTIEEYNSGNHVYDSTKCSLCQVTAKAGGIEIRDLRQGGSSCQKFCPWFKITGKKCYMIENYNQDKRIIELLDWISQYNKMPLEVDEV